MTFGSTTSGLLKLNLIYLGLTPLTIQCIDIDLRAEETRCQIHKGT